MGKEDLPTYDEHDHGLDADIKDVPLSTSERNARYERYAGVRQALADGQTTSLAAMNEVVNQAIEPKQRASRSALAVVYLRVSTEEQARVGGGAEGYSIPVAARCLLRQGQAARPDGRRRVRRRRPLDQVGQPARAAAAAA